ncbi:MAG: ssb [Chitinophagaceae bacterium]|nr:ssb [Chitinophagaceae bacterium]
MAGVNKVILLGNLGKDPEVRAIDNGRKVARFTLATTESYRNQQGERVDQTEWHNVVFWGPVTDVIEKYLKKGNQVYIEGKISNRSYDDKDGVKKYITEIVGQNLTLVGGKPSGSGESGSNGSSGSNSYASAPTMSSAEDASDDLPF